MSNNNSSNNSNRGGKNGKNGGFRGVLTLIAWALVLTVAFQYFNAYNNNAANKSTSHEIKYSDMISMIEKDQVEEVLFKDSTIYVTPVDGYVFTEEVTSGSKTEAKTYTQSKDSGLTLYTVYLSNADLLPLLEAHNVAYTGFYKAEMSPFLMIMIQYILPTIFIVGAFMLVMRLMSKSGGGGFGGIGSVGKANAKVYMEKSTGVTFKDVAGQDEAKESLEEIIDFLHNPGKYTAIGAKLPKGALLVGSPGTGKTLLAKAVAGEAGVPFFSISGSDFVEMFVGVGASRVRDLFSTAKKCAPAVVFIDEIDAVGRQRGAGLGGGHDEREQTLNQLLVEMDGFAINEGIIVLAATNRPDILDPALLRPGRFDRQITVNYPDVKGREEILKVHAKGKPLAEDVSLAVLAKRTSGFTGADLENVLNEAAILAARYKKKKITMLELEEAITRTVVGPEKKSRVVTDEDKKVTAYHEAGHAIVALKMPHCDPVHEVSIIPRGAAAGYTMTMPDTDDNHVSRGKILDEICMCMGGRVAESIALDDVCTGAIGDLKRASELARRMVIEFGMSDAIGPVFLGGDTEVFIAKDWGHQRNYSEEVAAKVDAEMRRILEEQFDRAKAVLEENREAMDRVVKALLEYERIDGDQFIKIFNGEPIEIRSYKDRKADLEKPDEEVLAQEQAQAAAQEPQVPPTAPEQPAQPEQPEQPDEK